MSCVPVVGAAGAERMPPGQSLAMLYDPQNPADSDFFFAAIESCLIVPPTDSPEFTGIR